MVHGTLWAWRQMGDKGAIGVGASMRSSQADVAHVWGGAEVYECMVEKNSDSVFPKFA